MKIDKLNGVIAFNEEFHKYFNTKNPDLEYISVTTIIGKYYEHFNEAFFSFYKAVEKLADPDDFKALKGWMLDRQKHFNDKCKEEVLEKLQLDAEDVEIQRDLLLVEWKKTNTEACEIGTAFHLERENEWYDKYNDMVRTRVPVKGDFVCKKHNFDLDREKAVIPEFLVYFSCPEFVLNLAGQVDLLIKDGNDIYILDYKTNAKGIQDKAFFDRATKSTKKMFYPINNLEDTVLNHYTLQLSTYAYMLKRINPEYNIKMLKLIHIDREGNETEFEVPYLEEEVKRMLVHYKRQIKIQKSKKSRI